MTGIEATFVVALAAALAVVAARVVTALHASVRASHADAARHLSLHDLLWSLIPLVLLLILSWIVIYGRA